MKRILLLSAVTLIVSFATAAQKPLPDGASKFFKVLGGLNFSDGNIDIVRQVAGRNIDKVEGGGGVADWTEVDGRVFVRSAWMTEIGEMAADYGAFELKKSLAAEMQKKLESEGFRLTPAKFDLHYIRYQKGATVGTVEVRSFYLNSGNLPLRFEFIFNESYRLERKTRGGRLH